MPGQVIVAIPVKNEEKLIGQCLAALTGQTRQPDQILLLLNNCSDRSLEICRAAQAKLPGIEIEYHDLPPARASAGEARRLALLRACRLARDGVILTTDADAMPDRHWVASNLAEIAKGADVVCGVPEMSGPEAGAAAAPHCLRRLEFDDMREKCLLGMLDEIASMVDPDPVDPWPRHQQNSGASIAMKAAMLRCAGGPPHVPIGEDRALVARFRLVDARIRHAPHIMVRVSGRLMGRAAGGMAETMKRRIDKPDEWLDEAIEPTVDAYRRAGAKARLRMVRAGAGDARALAEDLLIGPRALQQALRSDYFGAAWAETEHASPVLQRRRVAPVDLARETRQAMALLGQLRGQRQNGGGAERQLAEAGDGI